MVPAASARWKNLLLGTVTMKTLHISDVPITLVK